MRVIQYLNENNQWSDPNLTVIGNLEELRTREQSSIVEALNSLLADVNDTIANLPPNLQDMLDELFEFADRMGDRHEELERELLDRVDEIRTELENAQRELERDILDEFDRRDDELNDIRDGLNDRIDSHNDRIEQNIELGRELENRIREINEEMGNLATSETVQNIRDSVDTSLAHQQQQLNQNREVLDQHNDRIEQNRELREQLEQRADEMRDELNRQDGLLDELNTSITDVVNELQGIEERFDQQIADAEQAIEDVRSNLNSTREELEQQLQDAIDGIEDFDPSDLERQIQENRTQINQTNEAITLLATQEIVDLIDDRVQNNTAELMIQADLIAQRVTHTELDLETGRLEDSIGEVLVTATEIINRVATEWEDELTGEIGRVEGLITTTATEINLNVTELRSDMDGRVEALGAQIAMTATEIRLEVDGAIERIDDELRHQQSEISLLNNEIGLMVRTEVVNDLSNRVATNEAGIRILDSEILLRVSQTDFDAETGRINQITSQIRADLDGIDIRFQTIEGEFGDLSNLLDYFEGDLDALREYLENIEADMSEFEARITANEVGIDLRVTQTDFEAETGEINQQISYIQIAIGEITLAVDSGIERIDNTLQQHQSQIQMLSDEIALTVRQDVVDEINDRVIANESSIIMLSDKITLNVQAVEALEGRVATNESTIDMLPSSIVATVRETITDDMDRAIADNYSQLQLLTDEISLTVRSIEDLEDETRILASQIVMLNNEIGLFVTNDVVNDINTRVVNNEAGITILNDEILLRVSQTDFDAETGRINQITSQIRADLDGIELRFGSIETDFGNLEDLLDYFEGDLERMLEYLQDVDGYIRDFEARITANENGINLAVTQTELDAQLENINREIAEIQIEIGQITLRVDSGLQEIDNTLQQHESQISLLNNEIGLMVRSEVVDDINNRVVNNEAGINILNNHIELVVREQELLDGRITNNETNISLIPGQILSEVRTTITDEMGNSIADMGSRIDQQTDSIVSVVESVDRIDGLVIAQNTIIEQLQDSIALIVTREVLDEATGALDARITQIAMDIDSIMLEVRDITNGLEAQIVLLNNEIGLMVRSSDFDAVANRLTSAEASIIVQEDAIRMRVERTEFDRANEEFERLVSEINIELGRIDLTVSQEILDESFGVNQWIVTRYNVDLGNARTIPTFTHIEGLEESDVRMYRDSQRMIPFTGDHFIAHFFTNIWMNTARTVGVNLLADDGVNLFLNGASIGSQSAPGGPAVPIQIAFRQGWNTIEILFYEHAGGEFVDLGTTLSNQVDRMTANVGIGNRDSTRVFEAVAGITIELDRVAIEVGRIEEIDGRITDQLSGVITRLDGVELFANETVYNSFNQRIESNTSRINVLPEEINLYVRRELFDPLNERYLEMQSQIDMQADSIGLITSSVNAQGGRLTTVEGRVEVNSQQIALRLTEADLDGLGARIIASINLDVGGVTIRGDRVDLIGNVTFTATQNTANQASVAAQNAQSAANTAQAEANRVAGITDGHQTQLTNIFASGTLTSVEIRQFRTMRDEIGQERGPIRTQATNLGGMATQLTNEQNAWNALNNFVNGLPTGVNATHNVAEATVRGHFTLHAQRKGELMGQIQLVLRQRADEAQSRADAAHSVGTAAQNTANATQGIVSANSARWGHAADRVNDWAVGAINGQTNINGGLIQTHTIRTEHLVADFFEGYEIRGAQITSGNSEYFEAGFWHALRAKIIPGIVQIESGLHGPLVQLDHTGLRFWFEGMLGGGFTRRGNGLLDIHGISTINDGGGTVSINSIDAGTISMTGLLRTTGEVYAEGRSTLQRGYVVHQAAGTNGQAGLVRIARVTVTGGHQNAAMEFGIIRRNDNQMTRLTLRFNNNASAIDNTVAQFTYDGVAAFNAHISRVGATAQWDLFVQKSEGFDTIQVVSFNQGTTSSPNVDWANEHFNNPPAGATQAIATRLFGGTLDINGTIIETLGNASVFRAAAGRNIDLRDPTNTFRLTVRHAPNAGANQGHVGVNGNFNASGWISANSAGLWEGNNRALVQGGTAGNALHVRRGNLTVFPTANQNTTVRVYYTPSQMGSTPSQGQQFASANATTAVMGSAVLGISINDHRNYSVVVNLLRTNTTTTYTRWGVIWRAD